MFEMRRIVESAVTPEQEALRRAFLAECWQPIPEWHQTAGEKERADSRNAALKPSPAEPEQPGELAS